MELGKAVESFMAGYTGRDGSLKQRLDWWLNQFGRDIHLDQITPELADEALCALAQTPAMRFMKGVGQVPTNKPLSASTQNRYRAALASLFKYAKAKRWVSYRFISPLSSVKGLPEAEGRLCYLTSTQVEALMATARTQLWGRLPALIRVAFVTGLRKGSLMALRWRDYNATDRTLTVARTKNGAPIICPLSAEAVKELEQIRAVHAKPDELIFRGKNPMKPHNFRHVWLKALDEAGLERMPFHGLRHSTASHAVKSGASTLLVMNLLGHKSPRMAARYAHFDADSKTNFVTGAFA